MPQLPYSSWISPKPLWIHLTLRFNGRCACFHKGRVALDMPFVPRGNLETDTMCRFPDGGKQPTAHEFSHHRGWWEEYLTGVEGHVCRPILILFFWVREEQDQDQHQHQDQHQKQRAGVPAPHFEEGVSFL